MLWYLFIWMLTILGVVYAQVPSSLLTASSASLSAISQILNTVDQLHGSSLPPPSFRTPSTASFAGAPSRRSSEPDYRTPSVGGPGGVGGMMASAAALLGGDTVGQTPTASQPIKGPGGVGFWDAASGVMAMGSSALGAAQFLGAIGGDRLKRTEKAVMEDGGKKLAKYALDLAVCDPSRHGVCCAAQNFCHPMASCSSDINPSNLFEIVRAVPRCTCLTGFYGDGRSKGTGCTNIDECATGEAGCEQICKDKTPGFECGCREGYELAEDGKSCQDIDECALGISGCSQQCVNEVGGYRCICGRGYRISPEDQKTCIDIDECEERRPCEYKCHNVPGSFACSCKEGYRLDEATKTRCIDRNECLEGLYPDKRAACRSNQQCTNISGSFQCNCKKGFKQATEPPANSSPITADSDPTPSPRSEQPVLSPSPSAMFALEAIQVRSLLPLIGLFHRQGPQAPFRAIETLQLTDDGHSGNITNLQKIGSERKGVEEIPTSADYSWLQCEDIDECKLQMLLKSSPVCKEPKSYCENVAGSYKCTCPPGLIYSDLSGVCEQKASLYAKPPPLPKGPSSLEAKSDVLWQDRVRPPLASDPNNVRRRSSPPVCNQMSGGQEGVCKCRQGFRTNMRRVQDLQGQEHLYTLCDDINECVEGIDGGRNPPCRETAPCCSNTNGSYKCIGKQKRSVVSPFSSVIGRSMGFSLGKFCIEPSMEFNK